MFSVDFSLAAMSTHTSWKYYKNCVWTIIAWALLSVSLGYWEWVWASSCESAAGPNLWLTEPGVPWPGRSSPAATSGQPLSSFFSTLPTVGHWWWRAADTQTHPLLPTSHTGLGPGHHTQDTHCVWWCLQSSDLMDLAIASVPLLTHVSDIMLLLPVSGDVSVPGCSTAQLSPPTKYWSGAGAGAGVSGHQGSASCLSWPGFDTYFIGLFSDIKVWAIHIFRSILAHTYMVITFIFLSGHLGRSGPWAGPLLLAQKCTFLQEPELGPSRTRHNWDTHPHKTKFDVINVKLASIEFWPQYTWLKD